MKPFWEFLTFYNFGFIVRSAEMPIWSLTVSDRDINPYLAPELETPSRVLGQHFLAYAYSTPAGTAYRLAYGVNNPSKDNEA
jgi:hypothetical protein